MPAAKTIRVRIPRRNLRVGVPRTCLVLSCLSAVLIGDGAAQAQQARGGRAPAADDFICTSPTERREIRVIPGCRVDYVKNHATSTLWRSHDPAYCKAKAAGLVTTLVKANFSCKTETSAADAD